MTTAARYVQELDPRLKLAVALVLGPCLWKVSLVAVIVCGLALLALMIPLVQMQPLGPKMVRSLFFFVFFWIVLKIGLDAMTGAPLSSVLFVAGELGARLTALLLVGLTLASSTSARSLGLAVSWAIRPVVGRERAWRVALSLALMIHFLPLTLSTMASVRETVSRRCPQCGFGRRMVIIPQAVIRNLGQKTWNQTLAVAGRGLDRSDSWEPDFQWSANDWLWAGIAVCAMALMFAV